MQKRWINSTATEMNKTPCTPEIHQKDSYKQGRPEGGCGGATAPVKSLFEEAPERKFRAT